MAANSLIFKDAAKARDSITQAQMKEIRKLYEQWADEIAERANYYKRKTTSSSTVSEAQMRELEKLLRAIGEQVTNEVHGKIKNNIYTVADSVVVANAKWLASLGFDESSVMGAFNSVPDDIVRKLVTGSIYEGGWSLSKRIWGESEENLKQLYRIVAGGVAKNQSMYEISKQLEQFVRPSAKKQWNLVDKDGRKIYPRQVDYNAQRLGRTLVQHSYQQSFIETTKDNPFIIEYIWRSNGSRVCELCKARDGVHYKKTELPMDHPNGMCTMEPVVVDNDNIVDQLADWFNSPDGTYPEIDAFAGNFGYAPNNKVTGAALSLSDNYAGYLMDNVTARFAEKFGITPNISSISADENDFTGLMSGAYAFVEPADGSLHINPNIFKDEKTFYEIIGGRIRAYHSNATPESILAHEYGHIISLDVDEKKIIDNAVARYVENHPKSAMDAFIPDYQYAAESISHYAVTTEHELFAEAFGDVYANGDKAQELSKWIVEEVQRSVK